MMHEKYEAAARLHDLVEDKVHELVHPGATAGEVARAVEEEIRYRCERFNATSGAGDARIAFPVGVNVGACLAHWSHGGGKGGDGPVIQRSDVVKVDYGICVDGCICDAAFSVAFEERNMNLVETTRRACMAGATRMRAGAPVRSVSRAIEQEVAGTGLHLVDDLCGHLLLPYRVHNGARVVPNSTSALASHPAGKAIYSAPLLAGDVMTVEPFVSDRATTVTYDRSDVSHYMFDYITRSYAACERAMRMAPTVHAYGTLAFNGAWVPEPERRVFDQLIRNGLVAPYPPIYASCKDAQTAHFEVVVGIGGEEPHIYKRYDDVKRYVKA